MAQTGPVISRTAGCARRQNKATNAVTAVHAGTEKFRMLRILNTKLIDEIHDQWCRDNGYPVKSQASGNKSCKLQASGNSSSLKPQAQHELQASSIADHEHASSKPQA